MTLALFPAIQAIGQPPPLPPPFTHLEDPELYFAFFNAHYATAQQIQSSAGAAAATLASSTAALYNISAADLPKLTASVNTFATNLAIWAASEQAYIAQQRANNQLPDTATLIEFQRQRQRLVMNAYGSVQAALSPVSWSGLYGYINGAFKTQIQGGSN
jgi:hypothetical protein